MKKIIYMTYCCKNKAGIPENHKATPAELYISSRICTFINFCNTHNYCWGIFSDKYGLVFRDDKIGWYDKSPDEVTALEYNGLLMSTINRLQNFDRVFFYYCDESFHPLYRHLIEDLKTYIEITLSTNLENFDATN